MTEMICTCDASGVRATEARRRRIFRRMGLDEMGDLTTAILLSLAFDFESEAYIAADQWFGVSCPSPLVEDRVYVECDAPADGLAFLWEMFADRFPDRVSVNPTPSPMKVRVADRISSALLAQYEVANATYREHRDAAHQGPHDCPPCEDCMVYLDLDATARVTLDRAWGSSALDKAIDDAYAWAR